MFWFNPSGLETKMPPRLELKATMRQSGENAGSLLVPWPWVRRRYSWVAMLTVKMSMPPLRPVKAMRPPR